MEMEERINKFIADEKTKERAKLRDYFAAQAIAGMASKEGSPAYEYEAMSAYKYADAMLAARDA